MSTLKCDLLVAPQEVYTTSSTQGTTLGSRVTTGDGRDFRYVLAGATSLVQGKLQQVSAEVTGNQNLAVAAAAIGATSVVTTTTVTVTANQYAGGWLVVTITPGEGYQYQIASHPAATSAALTLTLSDPLQVALTTSSRVDLVANPYNGIIVNPTSATSSPIGVAVYPITNAQYGWIQTAGVASVLADGTVTVGTSLVASNGTAGAVEAFTGVQAIVGIAVSGIATTDYGPVKLLID